ncbi:DUF1749 domain-containing protein [Candidatus Saccharibacteria bacterium]|nr:DUF1749 domain-containing protein [Candidatus Saccharibacteria bacterium]MCA9313122.1 DUF1749 domain-containing protein [Candidatus Saccharibacteria bacterium]
MENSKSTVDFIRFKASDDVELQGWLNNEESDIAVVHIHGMSGNGYENYFLDNLRAMYAKHDISLFTIDSRGRGIVSDFRQGNDWKHAGSCFELFEESAYDIRGAIDYLKSLGKSRFILQGHSLGCTKVVSFVLNEDVDGVEKVILLAPTDMTGWANTEPMHSEYLAKAKQLLSEGKGEELVDAQCWLDKTPISAQTYPTICEAGSSADIYGERDGGALIGRVELPMLIPYGTEDIGITQIDGSMDKWLERVNAIKNANTKIAVVDGASHGFKGFESTLVGAVEAFIK